jgi:V/A-type H+-transporting ATPase subunit C
MSTAGSNPEYVIARVKARKNALYSEEDYRKLLRMGSDEITRFMEESDYETEINALGSRHSGVDLIEYALNQNLARQFNDLLEWANGRLYELIARYLRKFDAWNVKTAMRGIYSTTPQQKIADDFIRAGELNEPVLERLTEAASIEEVVELLEDTMFEEGLRDAYSDFEDTGVLVPLENAVDRAYYENLRGDLGGSESTAQYREFLDAEIDFRNLRNALRLAQSGADIDPAAYYIQGGSLFSEAQLAALVQDRDELVSVIRESKYGVELSQALDELEAADSLIQFERALDIVLLSYSDTLGTVYPLSITPVVSYILAKEREVENIRAIGRAREAGLSESEIETEVIAI